MESVDGKMTQEEYTEIRNKIIDLELRSSIDKVDRSKEIKELKKSIGELPCKKETE